MQSQLQYGDGVCYIDGSTAEYPPLTNLLQFLNDPDRQKEKRKAVFPPKAPIQVHFLTDLTSPPTAPVQVNFQTPDSIDDKSSHMVPPAAPVRVNSQTPACIEAKSSHLPYPEKAQVSVPSDLPRMHCKVHSSTIHDILGMNSPSTACAFTPPLFATTRNQDVPQPRVKKKFANVQCFQLSPAQAKVKKRSSAPSYQLNVFPRRMGFLKGPWSVPIILPTVLALPMRMVSDLELGAPSRQLPTFPMCLTAHTAAESTYNDTSDGRTSHRNGAPAAY